MAQQRLTLCGDAPFCMKLQGTERPPSSASLTLVRHSLSAKNSIFFRSMLQHNVDWSPVSANRKQHGACRYRVTSAKLTVSHSRSYRRRDLLAALGAS